jgi:hypothetical protein
MTEKTVNLKGEVGLIPSPVSFEKAEKNSADQVGTTQGKHPSK